MHKPSTYVIEQLPEGSPPCSGLWSYPHADQVLHCLEHIVMDREMMASTIGFWLWSVRHGNVSHRLALLPFVTMHRPKHDDVRLSELTSTAERLVADGAWPPPPLPPSITFRIDLDMVARALEELPPPLLGAGGCIEIEDPDALVSVGESELQCDVVHGFATSEDGPMEWSFDWPEPE